MFCDANRESALDQNQSRPLNSGLAIPGRRLAMKAARLVFQRGSVLMALALLGFSAQAQTTPAPVPPPSAVETRPLPPPMDTQALPAPSPAPAAPETSQAAPPVAAAPAPARETLAPAPADPSMPDQVELAAKPAALLRGASTWDDGYDKLTAAFTKLQESMAKFNVRVTGKPVAVFLETDDLGFRFEAQLPIERAPTERPSELAADIRFGLTPSGRAWRFVHRAPYDEIDSTYEAITAYLDQRAIDAKDAFIEEYVTLGEGPADDRLEINIFVQPR